MHPVAQHRPPRRRQQAGQVRLRRRGRALAHHHRRTRHREVRLAQGVQLHEEPQDGRGRAGGHLGQGQSVRQSGSPDVLLLQ